MVNVGNNVPNVFGENRSATESIEDGYTIRERRYGKVSRSRLLSQGVRVGLGRFILYSPNGQNGTSLLRSVEWRSHVKEERGVFEPSRARSLRLKHNK